MSDPMDDLDSVLHEVNSKTASLKGAAALIRKATPAEKTELLDLMAQHADGLARLLDRYRGSNRQP